jgi:hypothetical protein
MKLSHILVVGTTPVALAFPAPAGETPVNHAENARGLQLGFANYAGAMHGLQIGLVNLIEQDGFMPFFPFVTWSF